MNIERQEDEIIFRDLDSFLAELLLQLPESAVPGDAASRARIFGNLTGGRNLEADAEWRELNDPELRELFQSHNDVVAGDLKHLTGKPEEQELKIPVGHLPAWIHTLNQARLAIGARYELTEQDIEGRRPPNRPAKGLAILQVEIYGIILGFLLRHTDL